MAYFIVASAILCLVPFFLPPLPPTRTQISFSSDQYFIQKFFYLDWS